MRAKQNRLHLILFSLLFAFIPLSAQARDGTLYLTKGYVKVIHQKRRDIYTTPGDKIPVYVGDQIRTGNHSRAKLLLRKKTEEVNLYANTLINVTRVKKRETFMNFWLGKIRFKVKPLSRLIRQRNRRRFRLRTTTATIGVKGTSAIVATNQTVTKLLTLSGIVAMNSLDFPDEEIEIAKGELSRASSGLRATPPLTIPPPMIQKIINSDSANNLLGGDFEKRFESESEGKGSGSGEGNQKELGETDPTGYPELTDIIDEVSDAQNPDTETFKRIDLKIKFE